MKKILMLALMAVSFVNVAIADEAEDKVAKIKEQAEQVVLEVKAKPEAQKAHCRLLELFAKGIPNLTQDEAVEIDTILFSVMPTSYVSFALEISRYPQGTVIRDTADKIFMQLDVACQAKQ
jgi:hypothetical protein